MNEHTRADFTRVFDIIAYQKAMRPQKRALNTFESGRWISTSIDEFEQRVDHLATWLINEGFRIGDRIAIVPRNGSYAWMALDFAAQKAGLVTVPIHPSSPLQEVQLILRECGCKAVVTADRNLCDKFGKLMEEPAGRYHLEKGVDGYLPALDQPAHGDRQIVADRAGHVKEEDIVAIMYTSGSSGRPKGVVLSHRNVVSSIKSVLSIFPIEAGDRVLSFLPISHIFERTTLHAYLTLGAEICFSRSKETILDDFQNAKPVFCTSVPRMLETMYDYLQETALRKNMVVRMLVRWTLLVGERYPETVRLTPGYRIQLWLARLLVLNRWRRKLGGHIRFMAVGAAALRPEIARLFSAARIMTLAGYGMTEAAPYISVNRPEPGLHRFGTVGLPVPGVEIRIENVGENGEGDIWVRGPNITSGYLSQPDLTSDVLTPEGWLKTGDIGKMVDKRFLTLTSRRSEVFKTSTGKFVAPQPIESLLASSLLIQQSIITGLNRPFVSAVIVPNFSALQTWCESEHIHWTSPVYMVHNIKVIKKYQQVIDKLNEQLQSFERIRGFHLADRDWTVEENDLTTSFKLRRNELQQKYGEEIERLYS